MKEVRAMLTDAIMAERERCAKICEDADANLFSGLGHRFAAEIRSANPPHIQVVRPETAVADPSKVTQHTIVAGQGLVGDEIVDRFRMSKDQVFQQTMERAVTEMRAHPDPWDRRIQAATGGKFGIEHYSSK